MNCKSVFSSFAFLLLVFFLHATFWFVVKYYFGFLLSDASSFVNFLSGAGQFWIGIAAILALFSWRSDIKLRKSMHKYEQRVPVYKEVLFLIVSATYVIDDLYNVKKKGDSGLHEKKKYAKSVMTNTFCVLTDKLLFISHRVEQDFYLLDKLMHKFVDSVDKASEKDLNLLVGDIREARSKIKKQMRKELNI